MATQITKAGREFMKSIESHRKSFQFHNICLKCDGCLNNKTPKCDNPPKTDEEIEALAREAAYKDEDRYAEEGLLLAERFLQVRERLIAEGRIRDPYAEKPTGYYWIGISPDESKVTFDQFYKAIEKLCSNKIFHTYKLSFEQRSTDINDVGKGFHVHILAKTNPNVRYSKQKVIDQVYSTCKHVVGDKEFIDVKLASKPEGMFEKYCIEYDCKDEHKNNTKEADAIWRAQIGIAPYYENELYRNTRALSSPAGTGETPTGTFRTITTNGPIIVEMD